MRLGLGLGILPFAPKSHAATFATGSFTINDNASLAGVPATTSITITDYTVMTGGSLDIAGFVTLTEGVDFNASTSNSTTASNIATALNTMVGETVATTVGPAITFALPGDATGGEIAWSGSGVSPTTAVLAGGQDKYRVYIGSFYFTFGDNVTIGATASDTVANIMTFLAGLEFPVADVEFAANGAILEVTSTLIGTAGNATTISVVAASDGHIENAIVASGPTLTGGTDAT